MIFLPSAVHSPSIPEGLDLWFRLSLSIRLPDDRLRNQRRILIDHKTRQRTRRIYAGFYL